jgi:hypothetical protein
MRNDCDIDASDVDDGIARQLTFPSRHDVVLATIAVSLLVGVVAAAVTPLPLHAALGGGSAVSGLALAEALFRNPPGRPPRGVGPSS